MTWFSRRTERERSARRAGAAGALGLAAILLLGHGSPASAQQAPNAEAAAGRAEQARLADTDTLLALTSEGAVLYGQDAVKLSGYQYCSQAVALAEAGEFRQSVRAASKALHLANATRDPNLLAMANRDLAIVYSYSGQLEKAEEFAREALKHPARDPKLVVGPVQKVIGDVRTRRGDYAGAVISYDEALANSSSRYAPLVQASLVNALIESGDAGRAREVLAGMAPPRDAPLTAQLDRTRARLLLAENKPAEARDLYRALTARQVGTDTEYYRLWAWDGVARSELALGQKQAAAEAVARALGGIDQVRARFRSEEFKMGLFSDLQSVFERGVAIYSDAGDARQAFEVSERSRSRALLDAVRGRAKINERAATTVDLATLQGTLAPDERVVQFHSLPDRLLVWVVGPAGIEAKTVAVRREELTELVEVFRNSIVRGRRAAITNADKLGAALLGPLALAPGQRLIVVPHGPLHYLPFQALRLDGRYVIETHPVAVAPSISIAVQLAQRSPRVGASLTAFGNPRIEDKYDLPGAEVEVKQLAQLFPRNTVYMGAAATKTQFRDVAARSSLMHVAAHAEADAVDPLYSRILLANEGGKQNFLEAHEILGLPMDGTALVTLSACESGLGRIAQGDEVLGFTRSFLSAGSSSLIASLWPVSDDATAVLMGTLYGELAKGRDIQKAMQAGQLAVLKDPKMSHPFFWAPFNLIGNWRLTVGS
ncbi:CHAT domain-containing protein [Variovorax paradoxus]|jgi:CHAT domain-containing protein|uniref:CHAT domain-containing protein n=1 Tax=Variovorax paradoxus TaxID=34073 RepID=UPI0029C7155C|nr:CHAT domain-containing protein [Variovorax paradoxus]WPH21087.1 CHAT domain-containing protein [Variovorax paradoxus]